MSESPQQIDSSDPTASNKPPAGRISFDRKEILRAWAIFVLSAGAMFCAIFLINVGGIKIGDSISNGTAFVTTALLNLFGDEAELRNGNAIKSKIYNIEIIFECTGALNVVLLVAAILAMPSSLKGKLIGIFGGTAVLLIINQVRMVSLVFLGPHLTEDQFEDVHNIVWQSLMVVFLVMIFLFWASKYVRKAPVE